MNDLPRCTCCASAGCGEGRRGDEALGEKTVTCPECGEPCNCLGCVADASEVPA